MVKFRSLVVVAIFAALSGCSTFPVCSGPEIELACQELRDTGTTEVIVTVHATQDLEVIRLAQERVLSRLGKVDVEVLDQFSAVPILVLRTNRRGLRKMQNDPEIAQITSNDRNNVLNTP